MFLAIESLFSFPCYLGLVKLNNLVVMYLAKSFSKFSLGCLVVLCLNTTKAVGICVRYIEKSNFRLN